MQNDDWEIRKEACWAVSNCTASANHNQILALVQKGSLKAIGAMMTGKESRQLMVVLEALENILKCGEEHFKDAEGNNSFVVQMEVEGVIDHLEEAQMHKNHLVFEKASTLLNKYFVPENDGDADLLNVI